MQKQKVFFFAEENEGNDPMIDPADLLQMASDYVVRYGEACLSDPQTPSFVRKMLGNGPANSLQKAG